MKVFPSREHGLRVLRATGVAGGVALAAMAFAPAMASDEFASSVVGGGDCCNSLGPISCPQDPLVGTVCDKLFDACDRDNIDGPYLCQFNPTNACPWVGCEYQQMQFC